MPDAIREKFPNAKHQRCLVHYERNLANHVNLKDCKEIIIDFKEVIKQPDKEKASKVYEEFKFKWSTRYVSLRRMFERTNSNIFTYYEFPKAIRKSI